MRYSICSRTFSTFACGTGNADSDGITRLFLFFADQSDASREPYVDARGLRSLLYAVGERPSAARLHNLLWDADADRSGTIELSEFLRSWTTMLAHADLRDRARVASTHWSGSNQGPFSCLKSIASVFGMLDKDGDNRLSVEDLAGALSTVGGDLSMSEAEAVVARADANGDGKVDLQEFANLISEPGPCAASWRLRTCFRAVFLLQNPGGDGVRAFGEALSLHAPQMQRVSVGDAVRGKAVTSSTLGTQCKRTSAAGKMLRLSRAMTMLQSVLISHSGSYVFLDGFPGTIKNCVEFHEMFGRAECAILVSTPADAKDNGCDKNFGPQRMQLEAVLGQLEENRIPVHCLDGSGGPDGLWEQFAALNTPLTRQTLGGDVARALGRPGAFW